MNQRTQLIQKLEKYALAFPKEKDLVRNFIQFINEHEDCFYRTCLKGHITGSAFVVDDQGRTLLMHHRKLGMWFQPGGHSDGDPNTLEVALKEAEEETGLLDLYPLSEDIFDVDLHMIPEKGHEGEHYHYDIRFIFKTDHPERIIKNNESIDLKWFDQEALLSSPIQDSIHRMVEKMKNLTA